MNKDNTKKVKKVEGQSGLNIQNKHIHIIALVLFIIVPMLYLLPAIQGKILYQHDIMQFKYHSKQTNDFRVETGEEPLWNPYMFSGMPAFQGDIKHETSLGTKLSFLLRDIFPEPIGIFVAMCLNFYLLMIILGVNPWLSIAGAFVFAFSTFNVVSIESGHNSKINALAFAPGVIGGVLLMFREKILLGFSIFSIAFATHLACNHPQITYYLFFVLGILFLLETYNKIANKQFASLGKIVLLLILGAGLSIGTNTSRYWTTIEYSKESMRGGNSELTIGKGEQGSGLDKDYAMRWSHGILESLTWIIPNFMGGASQEPLGDDSNLAKRGVPKQNLKSIPTYWGEQPFTAGPLYQGAVVIFLFILGLLIVKGYLKWWLLSASILIALLSYGKNLNLFSDLLFNYLPVYNKFRAPSMIILFFQITLPVMGLLGLTYLFKEENFKNKEVFDKFKIATMISLGIVVVFGLLGSYVYDFKGIIDEQLEKNNWPVDALRADRAAMMRMDALRSLVLIAAAAGLIFAYLKGKLNKTVALVGIAVLMCGDVALVSKRYVNEDKFVTKRQFEKLFEPSPADSRILADTSGIFRVADFTTSIFNDAKPSYFHHAIGGYHGAKIQRYQEVIEQHISKNNMAIFDMLNTKYFIINDKNTNQPTVQLNQGALGNSWLVNEIIKTGSADEEMTAMTDFDPASQVVVDTSKYKDYVKDYVSSEFAGNIYLDSYTPKHLKYKAVVPGDNPQFAVFSEIYYNAGRDDWKVFIDGEPASHIRVNYILRGMMVPPGDHLIEFKFEPYAYFTGLKISAAFSILLIALFIGSLGLEYRKMKLNKEVS